jgi:hypothetical protein
MIRVAIQAHDMTAFMKRQICCQAFQNLKETEEENGITLLRST